MKKRIEEEYNRLPNHPYFSKEEEEKIHELENETLLDLWSAQPVLWSGKTGATKMPEPENPLRRASATTTLQTVADTPTPTTTHTDRTPVTIGHMRSDTLYLSILI